MRPDILTPDPRQRSIACEIEPSDSVLCPPEGTWTTEACERTAVMYPSQQTRGIVCELVPCDGSPTCPPEGTWEDSCDPSEFTSC
jgi:hypothetical protein